MCSRHTFTTITHKRVIPIFRNASCCSISKPASKAIPVPATDTVDHSVMERSDSTKVLEDVALAQSLLLRLHLLTMQMHAAVPDTRILPSAYEKTPRWHQREETNWRLRQRSRELGVQQWIATATISTLDGAPSETSIS